MMDFLEFKCVYIV